MHLTCCLGTMPVNRSTVESGGLSEWVHLALLPSNDSKRFILTNDLNNHGPLMPRGVCGRGRCHTRYNCLSLRSRSLNYKLRGKLVVNLERSLTLVILVFYCCSCSKGNMSLSRKPKPLGLRLRIYHLSLPFIITG